MGGMLEYSILSANFSHISNYSAQKGVDLHLSYM